MAKQAGGFLGGFNGRLGPVVGYRWKNIWCVRSQSNDVRNPHTEIHPKATRLSPAAPRRQQNCREATEGQITLLRTSKKVSPCKLFFVN